jgi:hypothetical protein
MCFTPFSPSFVAPPFETSFPVPHQSLHSTYTLIHNRNTVNFPSKAAHHNLLQLQAQTSKPNQPSPFHLQSLKSPHQIHPRLQESLTSAAVVPKVSPPSLDNTQTLPFTLHHSHPACGGRSASTPTSMQSRVSALSGIIHNIIMMSCRHM